MTVRMVVAAFGDVSQPFLATVTPSTLLWSLNEAALRGTPSGPHSSPQRERGSNRPCGLPGMESFSIGAFGVQSVLVSDLRCVGLLDGFESTHSQNQTLI